MQLKRLIACGLLIPSLTFATINQVRVLNDTDSNIYIHKGGFATSTKILPRQWKIFPYPFEVTPPNSKQAVTSSELVATAGGRWTTSPNGMTRLNNPTMMICINYRSNEHKQKSGNRLWTIQHATGIDPDCKIKPYKQPWAS